MRPIYRFVSTLFLGATLLTAGLPRVPAQESTQQPTPFSAWLDLKALVFGKPHKGALPIWMESVDHIVVPGASGKKTIFRVRLRHVGALDEHLQLRVFFRDDAKAQPTVTGWTETGSQPFSAGPLGQGVGTDTSESLIIPGAALDYFDIEVSGDGSTVRGAFVSSLRKSEVLHAIDFGPIDALADPFGVPEPGEPSEQDNTLFGRVRATLDVPPLNLDAKKSPQGSYEFSLDAAPMLAAITFEILGADPLRPLDAWVNGSYAGPISVQFPDLADPAYRGKSRPLDRSLRFRYTGWLRGQLMIPGHLLVGGLNTVILHVKDHPDPVVVRAVEIELKYPSAVFDYELNP
jgi:hypothetical protein